MPLVGRDSPVEEYQWDMNEFGVLFVYQINQNQNETISINKGKQRYEKQVS